MAVLVHPASVEPCEGGRFSAYITPDMRMLPCSFEQELRWAVELQDTTIEHVWNSQTFEDFRSRMRNRCTGCSLRELCLGGCPIAPEIRLCGMVREGKKDENQA